MYYRSGLKVMLAPGRKASGLLPDKMYTISQVYDWRGADPDIYLRLVDAPDSSHWYSVKVLRLLPGNGQRKLPVWW